jgi:hypothetical protein
MTILIATANTELVKKYFTRAKFAAFTANTCTFGTTEKTYWKALDAIQKDGINTYSLLTILSTSEVIRGFANVVVEVKNDGTATFEIVN